MGISDYNIRLVDFREEEWCLQKVVSLQNIVYEGKHNFTEDWFKKWYLLNPMGDVISFNAFYQDELVAHYACIPYKMMIEGRVSLGLLDICTVTHPNHRGKGLFKQLAQTTYEYAKNNGFEFVIGVANANSFPGYMKHFPFTFVSRLDVKVGWGTNITQDKNKVFSVYWDVDSFNWRMKCGTANYSMKDNAVEGRYKSVVPTFMGAFPEKLLSESIIRKKRHNALLPYLYVGLGAEIKSPYFNVPEFIKPSPFNLIFLDLTEGKLPPINKDNIFFQLFDFDVA